MPLRTMFWMPRSRSISSRSVAQNEPLPGLSMIGSPGSGFRLSMISPPRPPRPHHPPPRPGLAAPQHPPARPGIADPGADLPRAPLLVGGQVAQIGAVTLAGMDDVKFLR